MHASYHAGFTRGILHGICATEPREIAELRIEGGKIYLFVALDRTGQPVGVQLVENANRGSVSAFLEHLPEAVPDKIHTVLTDNGIQFAEQPRNRNTVYSRPMRFDTIGGADETGSRPTTPNHPWTSGQGAWMTGQSRARP